MIFINIFYAVHVVEHMIVNKKLEKEGEFLFLLFSFSFSGHKNHTIIGKKHTRILNLYETCWRKLQESNIQVF